MDHIAIEVNIFDEQGTYFMTAQSTQPRSLTAAEIAQRSGRISRQGVAKLLAHLPADALRITRGKQETSAWTFATVSRSERLLRRLEADARRQGYRNADSLFHSQLPAQPTERLDNIADDELNDAAKLRSLLLPFLLNPNLAAADPAVQI